MAGATGSSWVKDARGNPSRWLALALSVVFGVGAVAAALVGEGAHTTAALGFLFVVAFNVAFGRRSVAAQVASSLGRHPRIRKPPP